MQKVGKIKAIKKWRILLTKSYYTLILPYKVRETKNTFYETGAYYQTTDTTLLSANKG